MNTQEELLEAFRGLPPPRQQEVLRFAQRLLRPSPTPASLYAKAKKMGAVGIVENAPHDLSINKDHLAGFGCD